MKPGTNGACSTSGRTVTLGAETSLSAGYTVSTTEPIMNETVKFHADVREGTNYEWKFGNGQVATGAEVNHTFSQPGTYEVNLIQRNGDCTDFTSFVLKVNTAPAGAQKGMQVKMINGSHYAVFNMEQPVNATIQVLNALGQRISTPRNFEGKSGQVMIDFGSAGEGMYMIVLSDGKNTTTTKVVR